MTGNEFVMLWLFYDSIFSFDFLKLVNFQIANYYNDTSEPASQQNQTAKPSLVVVHNKVHGVLSTMEKEDIMESIDSNLIMCDMPFTAESHVLLLPFVDREKGRLKSSELKRMVLNVPRQSFGPVTELQWLVLFSFFYNYFLISEQLFNQNTSHQDMNMCAMKSAIC